LVREHHAPELLCEVVGGDHAAKHTAAQSKNV
jgi:hypothetical protein